jgi:monoamine oxidase
MTHALRVHAGGDRSVGSAPQKASRRDFVISSASLVASAYAEGAVGKLSRKAPRVVIVGAGLAGLNAAYVLRNGGCPVTVYEASSLLGGRVRTDRGGIESGVTTELGGEFIDSKHTDMLALSSKFGLPLIDTDTDTENRLSASYFFAGHHYSEEQVLAAFKDVAPRIAADAGRLSHEISQARHSAADITFDRMSLAEYFDRIGLSGWLRNLIEVAYVTEYGLDAAEQSSINFLSLISTDTKNGFKIFGDSDQRYKVRDGNALIATELGKRSGANIELGHRLARIRPRDRGFQLVFDSAGNAVTVDADIAILALPFTLLRQVDLGDFLPPAKLNAIRTLGYGTNAKLILGTHNRLWRDQGYSGDVYADLPFQTGWDASRLRAGEKGVFTFFLGGRNGVSLGKGTAEEQARLAAVQLDTVFPGFNAQRTGSADRVHWPTEPYALGSYACYRPGQWTTIGGIEGRRVGNLYFAGEHCSADFQGFMNGALETGRRAAQAILKELR